MTRSRLGQTTGAIEVNQHARTADEAERAFFVGVSALVRTYHALEVYRDAHLPVEQKAAGSTPVGGAGFGTR